MVLMLSSLTSNKFRRIKRCFYPRTSFSLIIIIVSFLCLLAFSGCRQGLSLPYTPIRLEPPPVELSLEKVYNDYMIDINEAEEKYMGKRFLFKGLVVDWVGSYVLNQRIGDYSIMVGNVKFKPRCERDLDQIFPGFIINVTGIPQSLFVDRILIITDCLMYIVEESDYELPPGY